MLLNNYLCDPSEKPLDKIVDDGGFTGIFRTIGCIGDSLSSGEFESTNPEKTQKGYHDYFEYSWGQYIARAAGCKVYNFSRGGMTAKQYWDSFAEQNDYWNPDKLCQAYILALGVNDLNGRNQELGSISDINFENYSQNAQTFCGYYARIIQRLKTMQPQARFFLMSMPRSTNEPDEKVEGHSRLLNEMANVFEYTYVLDFAKYAPVYDKEFKQKFFLGGHMNPMGYMLTAKMTMSYIDYIIRHNMEDFAQVGFIGNGVHNYDAKW